MGLVWVVLVTACGDDDGAGDARSDGGLDAAVDAAVDAAPRDQGPAPFDAVFMRAGDPPAHPMDDVLRLNQLQAEGTHNSYHRQPSEDTIADWRYDNEPLDEQLESQGVRAFELDVNWDDDRRRWRVLHIAVVDELTTCDLLLDCLATLRTWSDAHPGHHPLFVQIEPKGSAFPDDAEGLRRMDLLDEEIRTVFPDDLLVLPDAVQGTVSTLREAIAETGWPTLGETRGKTLFFLNCGRGDCVRYANEGAGLEGRVIFADSRPDDPWAAVRIVNGGGDAARSAVEAGFLVRSRAVSMPSALEMSEAELRAELDAVLATGAHIVSTDVPEPRDDVPVFVEMPEGTPSRCNPITAPPECTATDIEDPSRLVPE